MNDYRQRIKAQIETKSESKADIPEKLFCKRCGTAHVGDENCCAECGNNLCESNCENCGTAVNPNDDVCENCGTFQIISQCSFCGAEKDENDAFCCECGSPAAGIECIKCGHLSQFNFCPKCNQSLTEMAETERKRAELDPQYIKVKANTEELLDINKEANLVMKEFNTLNEIGDTDQETEQVFNFLNNYFKNDKPESRQNKKLLKPKEKQKKKTHIDLSNRFKEILNREAKNKAEAEEIKKAIQKKAREERKRVVKEMIAILNEHALTQNFKNAQEARNWFNARKIDSNNCVFNCNHAGAIHPNPNHCGQPHKGGKWIYVEKEIEWEDNGDSGYWKVAYL